MSSAEVTRLRRLLAEGVACVAAEEDITIIDGGTQAGVMQMIGEGRAAARDCAPLLGVCPAALVSWPGRALSPPVLSTAEGPKGGPAGDGLVPLEPNHTHFVLTPGNAWGDETEEMFALAAVLNDGVPSVAILANGGSIAQDEVLHNVCQGREIIVIRGSGRLADVIAAVVAGDVEPPDDEIAAIVQEGRITLFDIGDEPEALAALIRQKLFEGG